MWFRAYKDIPIDSQLIKEKVQPLHGIVGCEMHEINGWGDQVHHQAPPRKEGLLKIIIKSLFSRKKSF